MKIIKKEVFFIKKKNKTAKIVVLLISVFCIALNFKVLDSNKSNVKMAQGEIFEVFADYNASEAESISYSVVNSVNANDVNESRIQDEIETAIKSYLWPIKGEYQITDRFGWRIHPIFKNEEFHDGVDIAASEGTAIYAARDGMVVLSQFDGGYGNHITIVHEDGYKTHYLHASKLLVSANTEVSKGDIVCLVGSTGTSTGPHLDFRIESPNGTFIDPLTYFK